MREWFLAREPRERVILAVGAVVAVLIVFFGLIWRPLSNGSESLRGSVEQKSRLLVDLQRASAVGGDAGARTPSGETQSLVVLVDRTSQSHGLTGTLTRTRPEGADGISVTVRDAPFDALVGWLVALQTTQNLAVESATVNGTRVPGFVNGQLLLRRR